MRLTLALTLLFVAAASANAQVTKTPKTKIDLQKVAAPRKVVAIKPLEPSVKLAMVKAILKHRIGEKTLDSLALGASISLDVRNGYLENQAFLTFISAEQVSPNDNAAYLIANKGLDDTEASVDLYFYTPGPGLYLFDFSVGSNAYDPSVATGTLTFRVDGEDGTRQAQDLYHKDQHLLFATQITNPKPSWNRIILMSRNVGWGFYSVEISQLK